MFDRIGLSLLVLLAGVGAWHIFSVYLKRQEANEAKTRSFEKWADELYAAAHELIDADMNVARLEARLMRVIATVPPETAYQTIRRIGLGRQMENAILQKLEESGIGERLPVIELAQAPESVPAVTPLSRRRPG